MGKLAGGNENEMKQFCWLERGDEVFMFRTKQSKTALCVQACLFCSFSVVHPENPCWATLVSERRIQILLLFMKLSTRNRPQQTTSSKVLLDTAQTVKWYPTSNSVAPMTTAKITLVTSSHERCHGHSEELRLSLNNINKNGRNAAGFLWMVFHCNLFFLPLGELPLDFFFYR